MEYIVGSKGQVVIAKGIRDRLGVEPGALAIQRLVGDHLEIFFVPPPHCRSLKGALAPHLKRAVPPGISWSEVRERAWGAAAGEEEGQEPR
jgi:bifunctional DNA-binding transcriptional regulator/antitoxin component of YhaV-PrlF toxin-antitoxin module